MGLGRESSALRTDSMVLRALQLPIALRLRICTMLHDLHGDDIHCAETSETISDLERYNDLLDEYMQDIDDMPASDDSDLILAEILNNSAAEDAARIVLAKWQTPEFRSAAKIGPLADFVASSRFAIADDIHVQNEFWNKIGQVPEHTPLLLLGRQLCFRTLSDCKHSIYGLLTNNNIDYPSRRSELVC